MAKTKEVKEVMNSGELAEYLGYTPRTIYKLIRAEGLPASRIGGQFRFKKKLVDRWLDERMNQQTGKEQGKEQPETKSGQSYRNGGDDCEQQKKA